MNKKQQQAINAFINKLPSLEKEADLFWCVARMIVDELGYEDCVIYRVVHSQNIISQVAAAGPKLERNNVILNCISIKIGFGITGIVAKTGESKIVGDTLTEVNYIHDVGGGLSEICVPIIVNGVVEGVIDSESLNANHFDEADRELLEFIALLVSEKLALMLCQKSSSTQYFLADYVASGIIHDFKEPLNK